LTRSGRRLQTGVILPRGCAGDSCAYRWSPNAASNAVAGGVMAL
jgi:hypothetical protein